MHMFCDRAGMCCVMRGGMSSTAGKGVYINWWVCDLLVAIGGHCCEVY